VNPLLGIALSAAFVAGLAGGVHCAGMCGGIVHALCARPAHESRRMRLGYLFAYNGGRLASYTLAGALAGSLGQAGLLTRAAPQVTIVMLVLAGVALMLVGLYVAGALPLLTRLEAAGGWLWRRLQPWTSRFLPVTTRRRAFSLGALWGWLPCGMVYGVLLIALTTGNGGQGALLMLAFGLGTLPNLIGIGLLSGGLRNFTRARVPRAIAGVTVASLGIYTLAHLFYAGMPMAPGGILCYPLPG
jgi:sulfite exporter TauE/SafE